MIVYLSTLEFKVEERGVLVENKSSKSMDVKKVELRQRKLADVSRP